MNYGLFQSLKIDNKLSYEGFLLTIISPHVVWQGVGYEEAQKIFSTFCSRSPLGQFSCSIVPDSLRLHGLQHTRFPWKSITNSRILLKLMSIKLVMPSKHLILCHPLLLLPSIFPSIRLFSNESILCMRRPNYWSFSFSISLSNKYSIH